MIIVDHRRHRQAPRKGFVVATDSFLSGWGQAPGTSYYAIAVDTDLEAYIVMDNNLKARPEMKRVRFNLSLPKGGPRDHLVITDKHEAPRFFQEGAFAFEKKRRAHRDPSRPSYQIKSGRRIVGTIVPSETRGMFFWSSNFTQDHGITSGMDSAIRLVLREARMSPRQYVLHLVDRQTGKAREIRGIRE